MDYHNIRFTVEAGVARLTLNRPDKLNSFTGEMHAELRVALDPIQADTSVRVLVLTGAGRAFCAGQDLADPDMQQADGKMPDIGNVVEANYKPLVLRLQNLRVPTIAAVNGIAAGAGASVALACDPGGRQQVGVLPPGLQQDRPGAGTPAAPGSCPSGWAWPGAIGLRAAGRQAARREGRRVGADLGSRGRRRLRRPRRCAGRPARRHAHQGAGAHPPGHARRAGPHAGAAALV